MPPTCPQCQCNCPSYLTNATRETSSIEPGNAVMFPQEGSSMSIETPRAVHQVAHVEDSQQLSSAKNVQLNPRMSSETPRAVHQATHIEDSQQQSSAKNVQLNPSMSSETPREVHQVAPIEDSQTNRQSDLGSNKPEISAPICRSPAKKCIKTYYPNPTAVTCPEKSRPQIAETGAWVLAEDYVYYFDQKLANAVLDLMDSGSSIIEFGAGRGCYTHYYHASNKLSRVAGYDGAANIRELTGGFVHTLDLTKPHDVSQGKIDWVICFEVAEHIPQKYESIFLDNLLRPDPSHILLSWGVPSQVHGVGHVNTRENGYVVGLMKSKGYNFDKNTTQNLRDKARFRWFKKSLMAFHKS